MKKAVIFDLGNTLVEYFDHDRWPYVLDEAVHATAALLESRGLFSGSVESLAARVAAERGQRDSTEVVPLEDRLCRIFDIRDEKPAAGMREEMCRAFMKPVFACARVYEDTVPALFSLRESGFKLGILSNSPWGSPAELWHEEIGRLGLRDRMDESIFCREAGRRKPAPDGFLMMLERLGLEPGECVFVGDDPRWDAAGALGVGMEPVLVDRRGDLMHPGIHTIKSLHELAEHVRG